MGGKFSGENFVARSPGKEFGAQACTILANL